MPKVKPFDSEMRDRLSRSVIDRRLALEAIKKEKLGAMIGLGQTAIYSRYRNPSSFTANNIRMLAAKLKLSNQELLSCAELNGKIIKRKEIKSDQRGIYSKGR